MHLLLNNNAMKRISSHYPTSSENRTTAALIEGSDNTNSLIQHWKRFTFDRPSGGLRLKRDVLEYADCVRRFKIPTVDEKFSLLGTMVNVFIVAPESLPTLVDGTLRDVRDEVLRLIELRDDYKKAKVGNIVNSMNG
ncbi:hypothetical protein KC19_12G039600 [Ceratodon purpureus]|uniref:Exocyst complex component Sec10-like alpha-helical bundle domain-containing protein n=1 Tax=Ceratodon purpureus TaxID=3225 RepID=A0A8T0G3J3_CERPU|nr:hypothetical protein KC19_12G039600 [Ceratodon purpureus]